jgi:hypothetical protein
MSVPAAVEAGASVTHEQVLAYVEHLYAQAGSTSWAQAHPERRVNTVRFLTGILNDGMERPIESLLPTLGEDGALLTVQKVLDHWATLNIEGWCAV